jgi:hypothetical protein
MALMLVFKSLQVRLSSAEKVANCPRFSKLMEYVNDTTYTFIMSQIKNQNLQPRARRFTIDEKILSLSLLKRVAKGIDCSPQYLACPLEEL